MPNTSYIPVQPTSSVLVSSGKTTLTAANSITLAAAGSWSDVTDGTNTFQVTLTPSNSANKLFIFINLTVGLAASVKYFFRLVQDGTPILIGDSAGSRMQSTFVLDTSTGTSSVRSATFYGCITTGTTSSTTIKLQAARSTNATLLLNRSSVDTDTAAFARGVSTMSYFEFSA